MLLHKLLFSTNLVLSSNFEFIGFMKLTTEKKNEIFQMDANVQLSMRENVMVLFNWYTYIHDGVRSKMTVVLFKCIN